MSAKSKIAIIIPVHNALSYTQKSISELYNQISVYNFNEKIKIIVVDDGSTDGTSEWLVDNYPEVKVLKGNGNLWWSGSVNLGVKFALEQLHVEYILLWNNDCTTTADYFQNLLNIIPKVNSNKIIIASKVYYLDKPNVIFNMGGSYNKKNGKAVLIARDKIDSIEYEKTLEVDWTGGMGVLIHKDVFTEVGYFDEKKFPQYYGDCDFFLRAKAKGVSIIIYPNLKVWNDRNNTAIDMHKTLFKSFRQLFLIKSRFNLIIDFRFYTRHSKTLLGYLYLIIKYIKYFSRSIRHKILS